MIFSFQCFIGFLVTASPAGCGMVLALLLKKERQQKSASEAKSKYLCSVYCYSSRQLNTTERNYFLHITLLLINQCRSSSQHQNVEGHGFWYSSYCWDTQDNFGTSSCEPEQSLEVERIQNTSGKGYSMWTKEMEEKNPQIPHFSASQTEICIQLTTQCTCWQETVGSSAKIITVMRLLFPQQSLNHAKQ